MGACTDIQKLFLKIVFIGYKINASIEKTPVVSTLVLLAYSLVKLYALHKLLLM